MSRTSHAAPRRIRIPFLIDVVFVTAPEEIRQVEASGTVDRVHHYPTRDLPWWIRFYFRPTRFYDEERDLWFHALEPSSDPGYASRRQFLEDKAAEGYSQEDVERIAHLLLTGADDASLAHAMVQVVDRRFFGEEIPQAISIAGGQDVKRLGQLLTPWKYRRGLAAQRQVMAYCAATLDPGVHRVDAGHNIFEIAETTTRGLRLLQAHPTMPVVELFTAFPLRRDVIRIATAASTWDGLLAAPTVPGSTVVILKIGPAASATGDIRFAFGAGGSQRLCVFMGFFLGFMADVQQILIRHADDVRRDSRAT